MKKYVINLAIGAAAILTALLLLEVGVRLFAPQQLINYRPDVYIPAPTFGITHAANLNTVVNRGERDVSLRTDAAGFRIGKAGRFEAERKILILGDSFMEGLQVDYEETIAGLLEAHLAHSLGEKVAVWNTGVPGWDPNEYLLMLRSLVAREHFQTVVVGVTMENDIVAQRVESVAPWRWTIVHKLRWPHGFGRSEIIDAWLYPINDLLEQHSQLFVLVRRSLRVVLMKAGLSPLELPRNYYKSVSADARWTVTASILADIAGLCAQHGASAVFVLIPTDYQVDVVAFDTYVRGFDLDPDSLDKDQPNRVIGDALRSQGLDVVDPLPQMRAAARAGAELFGKVDPHLSRDGNALIAGLLEPIVLRRLRATAN